MPLNNNNERQGPRRRRRAVVRLDTQALWERLALLSALRTGWPARSASAPDTCRCWSTRAAPLRDPSADGC